MLILNLNCPYDWYIVFNNMRSICSFSDLQSDELVEGVVAFKGDSQPKWRRYCDVVCGLPSSDDVSEAAPEMSEADCQIILEEEPFWKSFLNVNAVVGLLVVTFLLGFFH